MYEACDGTIAKLRTALVSMNRSDAVNIIDQALEKKDAPSSSSSSSSSSSQQQQHHSIGKTAPGMMNLTKTPYYSPWFLARN